MALDLTFKQVCDSIKKDDAALIEQVNRLAGLALICSPMFLGADIVALLPAIAVKNELIKLGKGVFDWFSGKKDEDYLARQHRMQTAYGLICYTAFFEALDRQLPDQLWDQMALLKGEDIFIAKKARSKVEPPKEAPACTVPMSNPLTLIPMSFPHPAETLAQQAERHVEIWKQLGHGFHEFIQKLAFWDQLGDKDKKQIMEALEKVPATAAVCYEAQYFELARRFEDFAVWANLQEHKKSKELIASLSTYVQQQAMQAKADKSAIDIGFVKLHEAVLNIPETLKISQATDIVESLTKHYSGRINEPVAEEKDEPQEGKPRLSFPRVCDAFVPQAFKVLRQTDKTRRLEDEVTWKDLNRRDDLGAFLLSYLSSPYSSETPLVILGHPGSGKSLLTTVLSAQLMSKHYTAIRVPLREVDAEAGIVAQIQERISRITNISQDSWARLSGAFKNSPPVVILDGYDELLQASGKVFSHYLQDVQTFQMNETEQGRPVRVIVTSRITLIDKATIPTGATIIRLLEFDKRQRDRWISIWNGANSNYFKEAKIKEFALPKEDNNGGGKILSLAEQPLLLLMLALYDSQDNQLRKSKSLDRTILYDSLLRQFVERERAKDRKFSEITQTEQRKELDSEMQRLGVAALGMYNRRKLHILSTELDADLKFFKLERSITVASGRPLSQADLLLGSFFFVHKSKAQHKAGTAEHHEEAAAFEFLHNTFGEFLTADFILRQALVEVMELKALSENEVLVEQRQKRLGQADGPSRAWFASLIYTPLFTRPVVLEMLREWIPHVLKHKRLSKQDFLANLDALILSQIKRLLSKREMPSIIRKETAEEGYRAPFGDHPLLGHIAIYSINLIVLRAIMSGEEFIFDETKIGMHEDGARPWDRLMHIWRSWFSLDNLNGVTAVIRANRKDSQIAILAKEKFQVAESQSRLETCMNVAISLGDNISSGITGLLLFEPSKESPGDLRDIATRLESEKIDLEFQIALKRLTWIARHVKADSVEEFCRLVRQTIEIAVRTDRVEELEYIALSFKRGIKRLRRGDLRRMQNRREFELLREAIDPRIAGEVAMRNPQAVLILWQIAKEVGDTEWHHRFLHDFMEFGFRRGHPMEMMEKNPEVWVAWLQLVRELGGRRFLDPFERKFLHPEFFERALDPRTLTEISERNPDAALAWLKLAWEMGGEAFLRRMEPGFLERASNPRHLLELAERNPEAALVWMQLARAIGGEEAMKHFGAEFFERVFHPRQLLELSTRNPEAVLAWLRMAKQVGSKAVVRDLEPEFIKRAFDPRHLQELSELNPEAALTWMQVALELGGEQAMKRLEPEFLERALHPRHLMELAELNPEAALGWIQLAREMGGERFMEKYGDEVIDRVYRRSYLSYLLNSKPAAFAVMLRLARGARWQRAQAALSECLESFVHQPGGIKSLLRMLPLSALPDLQWIAQTTDNHELQSALRRLSGHDEPN